MDYKYELNREVFMFCVVIRNCSRWSDIDEQVKVLRTWEDKVIDEVYSLMSYGLECICQLKIGPLSS